MRNLIYYFVIVSLLIPGCSDEEPTTQIPDVITPFVPSILSRDIGNNVSSEDIYLELFTSDKDIEEVRVLLVRSNESSDFTLSQAQRVDETSFESISPNGVNSFEIQLSDINDVNGNSIENDVSYDVRIILVKESEFYLAEKKSTITLTSIHPLIGAYTGTWNDNFYTNFAISWRINSLTNGQLVGELFYTGNFTPCCNAATGGTGNDGVIELELDESNLEISSYIYRQDLTTYMGGCPGFYEGTGSYDQFSFALSIDYTGSDCDGNHTGGKLELTRNF
jgi:hypothetical protein